MVHVMRLLLALALTVLFLDSGHNPAENEWPSIRTGIWEESGSRTLPSGKTITGSGIKIQSCSDPEAIFKSWAGSGKAVFEQAGCEYTSRRTGTDTWEITTQCNLRNIGWSSGKSSVKLKGDSEFETEREFKEGPSIYRASIKARRVADCPQTTKGPTP
jgi:hypothetical protein